MNGPLKKASKSKDVSRTVDSKLEPSFKKTMECGACEPSLIG